MGGQRCFRHCLWLGLDELGRMLAIALASFAPAVAQSTPVAQSIPAAALAAASLSLAAATAAAALCLYGHGFPADRGPSVQRQRGFRHCDIRAHLRLGRLSNHKHE